MNLQGVGALVTGGASGLGRATASSLAARGATVTIFDLPLSDGEQFAAELGGGARFVSGDVTSEEDVAAAVAATANLRVLVSCAGTGLPERILGPGGPYPLEHFRKVIDVNLVGTFNVLRLAAAAMASQDPLGEERGVVVNTASIAGLEGQVGQAGYAASKAGIIGLTICAARDLASHAIRVNTIAPGSFDTPLTGYAPSSMRDGLVAATPHPRREGRPEEFAALVCHIIENPMLNGETIRLDAALRLPAR